MNDEQTTQPLTDAELSDIERRADITDSIDHVCDESTMSDLRCLLSELRRTRAERDKILEELQWYITDLGHEHWQTCPLDSDDCYLCGGHMSIQDDWKDSKPLGTSLGES